MTRAGSRTGRPGGDRSSDVTVLRAEPDGICEVLVDYEREHPETARTMLPRIQEGYGFSDEARERLTRSAAMGAFEPV